MRSPPAARRPPLSLAARRFRFRSRSRRAGARVQSAGRAGGAMGGERWAESDQRNACAAPPQLPRQIAIRPLNAPHHRLPLLENIQNDWINTQHTVPFCGAVNPAPAPPARALQAARQEQDLSLLSRPPRPSLSAHRSPPNVAEGSTVAAAIATRVIIRHLAARGRRQRAWRSPKHVATWRRVTPTCTPDSTASSVPRQARRRLTKPRAVAATWRLRQQRLLNYA